MSFGLQLLVAFGAFALASAVAGVAGADSLGIALSFGQIAFVLVVGWLILRGSPSRGGGRRSGPNGSCTHLADALSDV